MFFKIDVAGIQVVYSKLHSKVEFYVDQADLVVFVYKMIFDFPKTP